MFIAFEHVSKRFGSARGHRQAQVVAIDDVSLGVAQGQMLVLVGPSGSGKTTLLRCLAGLETPDEGVIRIGDREVFSSKANTNVPTERRDVGLIFQSYALWPHLTVERNVAYPLERRGIAAAERSLRVKKYLDLADCAHLARRYPHELSGGQQQRIALARALVYEPAVVLFDEPLSNLDTTLREHLRSQIRELQRRVGFTGVYVTHDQSEAFYIGDQVALLSDGSLVQSGSPDEIYRQPSNPRVARFVGMTNAAEGELTADGSVFVSLDLGRVPLQCPPIPYPAATPHVLMVRPEALRLVPPERDKPQATIVDRVLVGAIEEYTLELQSGLRWKARSELRQTRLKTGDQVGLEFITGGLGLFQAGPEARMQGELRHMMLASRLRDRQGIVLGLLVSVFIAYPILELLLNALAVSDGGTFLQPYREAFASPVAWSALWGTVWLTSASVIFGVPLAVLLAWIASSTDTPLVRTLSALPTLSLALSPLVGAIGWLILLAPRVGILNLALRHMLGLHTDVGPLNAYSIPMIVMLMTFYVVPFVYGPAYAAFMQVDSSLLEAARICGARPRAIILTITIPILRPAILAGALLAGVTAASMFAIPLILSSGTGLRVIPTQIYQYINQEGRPAPATAMASLLCVATIVAMIFYLRTLKRGRFVTVSGKGARQLRVPLGAWRWPALILMLLFLFLSLVVPLASVSYLSLIGFWSGDVFNQPVSLDQYRRLAEYPSAISGLLNSTWLSMSASSLALLVGLLIAYRRLRRPHAGNRLLAFMTSLPLGVPAIVLGLAFLFAFTGPPLPLYGTQAILVLAYTVHVLPISMRSCDAGLRQLAPELEEAGRVCGDTSAGVMGRVLVPILKRPLTAAWGLTFIILFRDIPMSILLYTPANIPSSVALLSIFDQGWITGAAAYSVIITIISVALVALVMAAPSREEA